MDEGEVWVLLLSLLVGGVCWIFWLRDLWLPVRLLPRRRIRWALTLVPAGCLALVVATLRTYASFDVRDAPPYLAQYGALGAAWVGAAIRLSPMLGVSLKDDAIERGNAAAAWALGGALVGLTLCYAGSNIGDGPGWWVVVFCAAISTAALAAVCLFLHWFAATPEVLTVERDTAAGIRVAGILVATGLVFGRGAAGDWQGATEAVVSFAQVAWIGAGIAVLGGFVERLLAPTPRTPGRPIARYGLLPGLAYVGASVVAVAVLGIPQ